MTNDPENNDNLMQALHSYALKQDIRRIHNEMMPHIRKKAPVKSLFTYANRIAAAILVLFISAAIVVYFTSTPSSLFNSRYEPYQESAQRGDSIAMSAIQRLFSEGQKSLQQGNAGIAANNFAEIIKRNKQSGTKVLNDDAEYYLGFAYLKQNEAAKALAIFQRIYDNKNHLYNDKITGWFLARLRIAAWKEK